ncbi:ABC-type amino acid transport/signal transduction system, periplasmic component/domain [alpha proteobacterium BAL199]|jgi:polar amino acid transport system substrate-binding protein|nr:ABC-type amino acid transport/signal transduction system, periplasmic component/domain [alpha proteobacterium BAL199]
MLTALFGLNHAHAQAPAAFEGRPTVRIAYETVPNPPRHLGEGTAIDWSRPGLTLELLKRVGQRLEVNLSFKRVPWKRGLLMLETGEIDGIFHASYKAERESIGVYPKTPDGRLDESRAVFFQSYMLFVPAGSSITWNGTTLGGLDGRPIGATAGYAVVDVLERLGARVEVGRTPSLNFPKLLEGRLAAYAELENLAGAVIRSDPARYASVSKLEPPLRTSAYYLMLSHAFVQRDRTTAEAVWDTIAEVRESDDFRALDSRYADGS